MSVHRLHEGTSDAIRVNRFQDTHPEIQVVYPVFPQQAWTAVIPLRDGKGHMMIFFKECHDFIDELEERFP